MPAKPFDINEYIKSLKLSEEEEKAMRPILEKPERVEEIKRGWNSQSESSRLVDEASTLKTAAAAEKAEAVRIKEEAEAERARNTGWADALKKYEADTQATAREKDKLAAEKEGYEAYIKSLGIDPSLALEGARISAPPVPIAPAPAPAPAPIDPKLFEGYVKKEDYYKEVAPAVRLLSDLPFELNAVQFRHMELYQKAAPVDVMRQVQQKFLDPANKRPLSEIAAEEFHFADREKALSDEALEKEATRRADEMFTKRMSELNLPSATLDTLTPGSVENAAKFASDGFAKNSGRATDANSTQIGAEEMQAFLQADQELAGKGVHMLP